MCVCIFPLCVWVPSCECICQCPGKPEEGLASLDLELQTVLSYPVWVLGALPLKSTQSS